MSEVLDGYDGDEPEYTEPSIPTRTEVIDKYLSYLQALGITEKQIKESGLIDSTIGQHVEWWLARSQQSAVEKLLTKLFRDEKRRKEIFDIIWGRREEFLLTNADLEQIRLEAMGTGRMPEYFYSVEDFVTDAYVELFISQLIAASRPIGFLNIDEENNSNCAIDVRDYPEDEVDDFKTVIPSLLPLQDGYVFAIWVGHVLNYYEGTIIEPFVRKLNHCIIVPPSHWDQQAAEDNKQLMKLLLGRKEVFRIFLAREIAVEQIAFAQNFYDQLQDVCAEIITPILSESRLVSEQIWIQFLYLLQRELEIHKKIELSVQDFESGNDAFLDDSGSRVRSHTDYIFRLVEDDQILVEASQHMLRSEDMIRSLNYYDQNSFDDVFWINLDHGEVEIIDEAGEISSLFEVIDQNKGSLVALNCLADWLEHVDHSILSEIDAYHQELYDMRVRKQRLNDFDELETLRDLVMMLEKKGLPGAIRGYYATPDIKALVKYPDSSSPENQFTSLFPVGFNAEQN